MDGIQAWVALPLEHEECPPAFAHHGADDLPTYAADGLWARLVAGEAFGAKAAVRTHSPMFYVHWKLDAGTQAQLPAEYPERAAYVASGEVEVDGAVELRKTCKIRAGQQVRVAGTTIRVRGDAT